MSIHMARVSLAIQFLTKVQETIVEPRCGMFFEVVLLLQDNVSAHKSNTAMNKLCDPRFELEVHPPYFLFS